MHSLLSLAVLLTGCLAPETFDVEVSWSTANPPTGLGIAHVEYPGYTKQGDGYTGTTHVSGETTDDAIEICVQLGSRRATSGGSNNDDLGGSGDSSLYWVADTDRECKTIPVDQHAVSFTF